MNNLIEAIKQLKKEKNAIILLFKLLDSLFWGTTTRRGKYRI